MVKNIILALMFISALGYSQSQTEPPEFVSLPNNYTYEKIMLYLEKNGITNGPSLISNHDIRIMLVEGEPDKIGTWNVPGVEKPNNDVLLPTDIATNLYRFPLKHRRAIPIYPYFEILSESERLAADEAEEASAQSTKIPELKIAEKRVITFLRSEGVLTDSEKRSSKEKIMAFHASLDALPDQDAADLKRMKYDSLIRRVEGAGGTEFDVYAHP